MMAGKIVLEKTTILTIVTDIYLYVIDSTE